MALKKTVTFPNGTKATYWKIVSVSNLDTIRKTANVYVRGYLDKATRDASPEAGIVTKAFKVSIADTTGNILEQAYSVLPESQENMLKLPGSLPFFDGATDL